MDQLEQAPSEIDGKPITYRDGDGHPAINGVGYVEGPEGELMFFELVGQTGIGDKPYVSIEGQQKYRRIFIKRVYPTVDLSEAA